MTAALARLPEVEVEHGAAEAWLGCLLLAPSAEAALGLLDRVRAEDLYLPAHHAVRAAVQRVAQTGARPDPVLVATEVRTDPEAMRTLAGGADVGTYLVGLAQAAPFYASAGHYARVVLDQARRRAGELWGTRLAQAARQPDPSTLDEVLEQAQQALTRRSAPPGVEPTARRSWQPVDLTDVLAGIYTPPLPTVGARTDGAGLFYPGRVHSVASESEAGKTWLALAAVATELAASNSAVYLDFEDDEGGLVGRLLSLGVDRQTVRDRFAYLKPDESLIALGNAADLGQVLGDLRPTLVVLDGITEAMTLHGMEVKDNGDVARFGKMLPSRIAACGPAAVNLDHVVKDRENRGKYALGGVHKLNGLNGAAYVLDNRTPFGIGITGRSTVYVVKDRPGQLRRNALPSSGGSHWYADLVLTSHHAEHVGVSIESPAERDETFRPTVLMARVSEAITRAGQPLTVRDVLDRVKGKRDTDVRSLCVRLT